MINHKGTDCPYKPLTCSEGYCNDCQIYLDFKGHERTMGRISSSIYPIDSLRNQIQAKRDWAFAEASCGSREHKLEAQAMMNAYDVVLNLIDKALGGKE